MTKTPAESHSKISTGVIHTLLIAMLFILPELVMMMSFPNRPSWGFYPGFYVKAALYLGVFYLNYYLLVDRHLAVNRPAIMRFVLINLLVIMGVLALTYFINDLFMPHYGRTPRPPRIERTPVQQGLKFMSFMLRDVVMCVLTVGLAVALRLSTRWKDIRQQQQQMLAEQRSVELESLRSQLHPHFLFNTLNTIYALIDIRPDDARSAVHRLSAMLRYMLYDDTPTVPLAREREFIDNYVSLMKLRIRPEAHPITYDVDVTDSENTAVPPLLLIPLVENAFKYGITGVRGTPVEITLRTGDGRLTCITRNSFTPAATEKGKSQRKSGIGLANLRRRLVLIYGEKASLTTRIAGDSFTAILSVPAEINTKQK